MATIDQQFVEYIVKSLVKNPDDVVVDRTVDERGVLLTLTVNPEDLGRVIGRGGTTAQSLRTLLRALGVRSEARYNLKIVNNDEQEGQAPAPVRTENQPEVQPVDKPQAVSVENTEESNENYAEKSRKELADLDEIDV